MERQNPAAAASLLVVNDENDLSDANRSSMSILGSLERLVETSFKPELASAQQVLLAKRAFATAFAEDQAEAELENEEKKMKLEDDTDEHHFDTPPPPPRNAAAMKFLKYSELAKELSSSR